MLLYHMYEFIADRPCTRSIRYSTSTSYKKPHSRHPPPSLQRPNTPSPKCGEGRRDVPLYSLLPRTHRTPHYSVPTILPDSADRTAMCTGFRPNGVWGMNG